MRKKIELLLLSGMLMLNICGCFALVVGVMGGAGTAVWLSGKLTQEFHASYHRTIDATRLALKSLSLQVVKETDEENITQIKGLYSDGREMWIDINRMTDNSTKVNVRVGGISPDKVASSVVLTRIQKYL